MNYKDINGKKFKIDDVVVLHDKTYSLSFEIWERYGLRQDTVGVVVGWGCVRVQFKEQTNMNPDGHYACFNGSDLEIIGTL